MANGECPANFTEPGATPNNVTRCIRVPYDWPFVRRNRQAQHCYPSHAHKSNINDDSYNDDLNWGELINNKTHDKYFLDTIQMSITGKYSNKFHWGRCPGSGRSCSDQSHLESITRRSGAPCGVPERDKAVEWCWWTNPLVKSLLCWIYLWNFSENLFKFSIVSRHYGWLCKYLTFNVREPNYLGLTRSISWLLMRWLVTSPGH